MNKEDIKNIDKNKTIWCVKWCKTEYRPAPKLLLSINEELLFIKTLDGGYSRFEDIFKTSEECEERCKQLNNQLNIK